LIDRVFKNEGSTLVVGILRIATVLLLWSRYAWEVHPMKHRDEPEWLALSGVFYVVTLLMGVGLWTRVSAPLTAATTLAMYFGFGIELGYDDWAHHHTYTLMTLTVFVAMTPCGRSLSVDRWLALRRGTAKPERADLWPLRLLAWQCSMIYFWGAYQKTSVAYLGGDRLEQIFGFLYFGSDFPESAWLHPLFVVSAVGSVLLEYALAVLPWFKRTRVPILVLGCLFHAVIYWSFPVATFSMTMVAMYLAYFPPDDIETVVRKLRS